MQTERVTFLTSADHKAALDAFASKRGESVGNVVREATAKYLAQAPESDEEAELAALLELVRTAVPQMQASLDRSIARLDASHSKVDRLLRESGVRT